MIEYAKEKKKDFWKDLAVQGLKKEVFILFFFWPWYHQHMQTVITQSSLLFFFLFIINYISFADMEKLQETLVTK